MIKWMRVYQAGSIATVWYRGRNLKDSSINIKLCNIPDIECVAQTKIALVELQNQKIKRNRTDNKLGEIRRGQSNYIMYTKVAVL